MECPNPQGKKASAKGEIRRQVGSKHTCLTQLAKETSEKASLIKTKLTGVEV